MANPAAPVPPNYVTGILGASGGYTEGLLIQADDHRRFSGLATFLKAPPMDDPADATIGIVGVPFDGGSSRTGGSRFGPRGVRDSSFRISGYNAELDVQPFEAHRIVDCGDILVSPFSITDTYQAIQAGVAKLHAAGMLPVAIGGDHSITLPLLRAAHAKHGPLSVVHFDAHCDVSDSQFGADYHYGSVFRRAVEEGIVAPDRMIQIGIRKHYHPGEIAFLNQHGIERVTTHDLKAMAPTIRKSLAARLARLAGSKIYVTFDMDFVDSAHAPGIGSPEPFGPTSFEAVEALRALTAVSRDIVAMDLVELSPVHDVSHLTAYLTAQILFEMVCIVPATS
ncbi:agmatinase [Pikeienuella sp. HZG-20]|uniref:agmatinase n=1 Tax=Paludibacillus litoralis TaxID=3133267 RepID=UPI0030ED6BC5